MFNIFNKRLKKELAFYKNKYLHRRGSTLFKGKTISYNMLSTNGGKNWYLMDKEDAIIGDVESIHPGLIKHLTNIDCLYEGKLDKITTLNNF